MSNCFKSFRMLTFFFCIVDQQRIIHRLAECWHTGHLAFLVAAHYLSCLPRLGGFFYEAELNFHSRSLKGQLLAFPRLLCN